MSNQNSVRVLIGGDVSTHYSKDYVKADAAYTRELLRELKGDFEQADFRLCNLENVICEEGLGAPIIKCGPNLRGEPIEMEFLTEGGFDAVFLANNHLGDLGPEPVLDTIRRLDEAGIGHCGGGKNLEEAYRAWHAEKNGLRIAFISVCENEFGGAEEDFPGSAAYNEMLVRNAIVREKATSDFVVIIFHGGQEMNPVASPSVIDRYRLFTVFGADAVVAMHTHCIQGNEIFEGKPIIYSMGNFYFNTCHGNNSYNGNSAWFYGYMTELFFEKGKPVTFRVIPYQLRDEGRLIHVFEGEEREKMMAYIDRLSAIIQDPKETQRLYDAWCVRGGRYQTETMLKIPFESTQERTPAGIQEAARVRNRFTCEAHCAMITRYAHLTYLGRAEEALKALPELTELQKMPV